MSIGHMAVGWLLWVSLLVGGVWFRLRGEVAVGGIYGVVQLVVDWSRGLAVVGGVCVVRLCGCLLVGLSGGGWCGLR